MTKFGNILELTSSAKRNFLTNIADIIYPCFDIYIGCQKHGAVGKEDQGVNSLVDVARGFLNSFKYIKTCIQHTL